MKQKLIIFSALLSLSLYTNAQEYRIAKSSGTLKLNITGVIVEGYDGNEIIFSGEKVATDEITDERAKGLVPISTSKYVDNTGLGINVNENGQDLNVNLVAKKPIGVLTIKVPNNIKVAINNNNGIFFSYNATYITTSEKSDGNTNTVKKADEIILRNLKNEIEVSVSSNNIRLENNSGPMSIKTVSGSVDAIFSGEIKGPVSIISVNNYVDITLPAATKANIEMGTSSGKLFAGKEFKIDIDKTTVSDEALVGSLAVRPSVNKVAGQEVDRYASRVSTTAQGQNRAATRSTKSKDTATVVSVNGQHILPSGVASVRAQNTLSGTITTLDGLATTKVNGIQVNGETVHYAPSTSIYSLNQYFRGGDRIKGKLNGGGIDLIFKSTNKNVYLRQQ